MSDTPLLALPQLAAEQAQKHVTHNEALLGLDALVQLSVKDRHLSVPPGSPVNGDRYIVASGASGGWSGHAGEVASRQDGVWVFHQPHEGWRCWVEDENALLVHDGGGWTSFPAALQNLTLFGLGTAADATNPFAAKLNKALWTAKPAAEGGDGDLRYTLNKEAAGDVVSFLLQRGFSGRAELGLIGDDELVVKMSADGAAWVEALRLTAAGALQMGGAGNTVIDASRHFRPRSYTIATLPSASPEGQLVWCSDLGGGGGLLSSDGGNWRRVSRGGQQTTSSTSNFTRTVLTHAEEILLTGTLPADRTITLSTSNAYAGARFRFARTGGGTFNFSIGGLKNLATNSWCEVIYDGAAWYLAAYGAL